MSELSCCPICRESFTRAPQITPPPANSFDLSCPNCGGYRITTGVVEWIKKRSGNERALLSYAIHLRSGGDPVAILTSDWAESVLSTSSLPRPGEQLDMLLFQIGAKTSPGEKTRVHWFHRMAALGARSHENVSWLVIELERMGLVVREPDSSSDRVTLTSRGWEKYEALSQGRTDSRKAFMAMQYGESILDKVFRDCFRPAVALTGFHLERLDDRPKAGLIDNHLRVEIRTSHFLIADLTHENRGAYWEAGFAEGLGKHVIYTCEDSVFRAKRTHFDTEHHQTIIWNENELGVAAEDLKTTIRATLPTVAIMEDPK